MPHCEALRTNRYKATLSRHLPFFPHHPNFSFALLHPYTRCRITLIAHAITRSLTLQNFLSLRSLQNPARAWTGLELQRQISSRLRACSSTTSSTDLVSTTPSWGDINSFFWVLQGRAVILTSRCASLVAALPINGSFRRSKLAMTCSYSTARRTRM
jgi:hypothetical protein